VGIFGVTWAAMVTAMMVPSSYPAVRAFARARQTAQILARVLGLPTPARVPGLRERHAGQWTRRTSQQIQSRFPGELDRWQRGEVVNPPGSEPWDGFSDRVLEALGDLAATGIGDRIVVVAHQGVLRALEHHFGITPCPAADLGGVWLRARRRGVAWLVRW